MQQSLFNNDIIIFKIETNQQTINFSDFKIYYCFE